MSESTSYGDSASSLWRGIYSFPFQLNNLKAYILVTLSTIMLAFIASGFAILTDIFSNIPERQQLTGVGPYLYGFGWRISGSLFLLTLLSSLAPAAFLLIIIEDTAAGNDEIDWPDAPWHDYLGKFAFVAWIFICCAAVSTVSWGILAIALPIPRLLWWALALSSIAILFPIPLYSAMIGGAPWFLIHPLFLVRLIQNPLAALALYIHSLVLFLPCLGFGFWMMVSLNWWLSPVIGLLWGTCVMCYGRALGRVGYVLAEEKRRVVKKRKRKKIRVRRETVD
jgi:hypothetical protein